MIEIFGHRGSAGIGNDEATGEKRRVASELVIIRRNWKVGRVKNRNRRISIALLSAALALFVAFHVLPGFNHKNQGGRSGRVYGWICELHRICCDTQRMPLLKFIF